MCDMKVVWWWYAFKLVFELPYNCIFECFVQVWSNRCSCVQFVFIMVCMFHSLQLYCKQPDFEWSTKEYQFYIRIVKWQCISSIRLSNHKFKVQKTIFWKYNHIIDEENPNKINKLTLTSSQIKVTEKNFYVSNIFNGNEVHSFVTLK